MVRHLQEHFSGCCMKLVWLTDFAPVLWKDNSQFCAILGMTKRERCDNSQQSVRCCNLLLPHDLSKARAVTPPWLPCGIRRCCRTQRELYRWHFTRAAPPQPSSLPNQSRGGVRPESRAGLSGWSSASQNDAQN